MKRGIEKRILALVLFLALIFSFSVLDVSAANQKDFNMSKYENGRSYVYDIFADTVTSYLTKIPNGYLRFDCVDYFECYFIILDENYNATHVKKVGRELDDFGSFYCDGEYCYILTGQHNRLEEANVECFRVTQYDLKGNRIGSVGFCDCDTTIPFDCGGGQMVVSDGKLYVHTSHEMYAIDGVNHESNISFTIDLNEFSSKKDKVKTGDSYFNYCSHSFNEYIIEKDGLIFTADHGDAYPRGISIAMLYQTSENLYSLDRATIKEFPGEIGANQTKATLGGIAVSSKGVLTVGTSVDKRKYNSTTTENVYLDFTSFTKDSLEYCYNESIPDEIERLSFGKTKETKLTNYEEGKSNPLSPYIVDLGNDTFAIIWQYGENDLYCQKVDASGNLLGKTKHYKGDLSTCQPISVDGKVVWYKHINDGASEYYELDSKTMNLTVKFRQTDSNSAIRLYGDTRYDTALMIAENYKEQLGVSKLDTIVVAFGQNYADALSGSYLACMKSAPIILVNTSKDASKEVVNNVKAFISRNLSSNGTVYILGGTSVISKDFVSSLEDGKRTVKRLSGDTRLDTNIAILNETGFVGNDLIICDAWGFADALSASALGKPILLVGDKLTTEQKDYLRNVKSSIKNVYVLGGPNAVSTDIDKEVNSILGVNPTRVSGETRYDTSVAIAKKFFKGATTCVAAYGRNYPDGLCGGPLAYLLDAPLLLSENPVYFTYTDWYNIEEQSNAKNFNQFKKYYDTNNIKNVYILGGYGSSEAPLLADDFLKEIDKTATDINYIYYKQ